MLKNLLRKTWQFGCLAAYSIALLTISADEAGAVVLVGTSGMDDPLDNGFAFPNLNLTVDQFHEFAGSDGGEDFWQVEVVSGRTRAFAVNLTDVEIGDAMGWTATMRARLISADAQTVNLNSAILVGDKATGGGDPARSWGIGLIGGPGATHPVGAYAFGPGFTADTLAGAVQISAIDPTLAFNNYQVVYDPSTEMATFYVNGVSAATLPRGNFPTSTVAPRFLFGDGVLTGPASAAQYSLARFDIGQHPVADGNFPTFSSTPQVVHQGQGNPVGEGFALGSNATTATVFIGPGSDSEDHWRLTTVDPSAAYVRVFTQQSEIDALNSPEGWLATARLKLINSDTTSGSGAGQGLNTSMEITDKIGQGSFVLSFIGGPGSTTTPGIYALTGTGAFTLGTQLSAIDPTLDYHTYQLRYDPLTDSAQFVLDGADTGAPIPRSSGPVIGIAQPRFNFGDSTSAGTTGADVQFSLLKFQSLSPGDVNFDGVVDIFDVNLVSSHWNEAGPMGDANHDGSVDIFDINLISSNWNPLGGVSVVPEPGSVVLAVVACGALLLSTRSRMRFRHDARRRRSV